MTTLPNRYHRDHTGKKYGMITALGFDHYDALTRNSFWLCRCKCGTEKVMNIHNVKTGQHKSCGCANQQKPSPYFGTKIYQVFRNMKSRCYSPKHPMYKNYGERGIVICDEWLNDELKFFKWAEENGYQEGLIIDRIDVNGNYTPENCRFVDNKTSMRNTRRTMFVTFNNETRPFIEWCEILGINYSSAYHKYIFKRQLHPEIAIKATLGEKVLSELLRQLKAA